MTELDKKLQQLSDEESLTKLLHATEDFEDRRKIRAAIRDARKKKQADADAAAHTSRSQSLSAKKEPILDLEGIDDENTLRDMLEKTEDYEAKKKIRAAIRELRTKAREAAGEVIFKEEKEYVEKLLEHEAEEAPIEMTETHPGVKVDSEVETKDTDWSPNEVIDIQSIDDIAILERMLGTTEDFGERSQIRAHIKELHDRQLDLDVPDYPETRRLSEGLDAIWLDERGRRRSSVIDRAALEELTSANVETEENIAYDEIEDVEELERLLEKANDIGEKRLIRSALGELKKKLASGNECVNNTKNENSTTSTGQSIGNRT